VWQCAVLCGGSVLYAYIYTGIHIAMPIIIIRINEIKKLGHLPLGGEPYEHLLVHDIKIN
jgi:hypothetical protein